MANMLKNVDEKTGQTQTLKKAKFSAEDRMFHTQFVHYGRNAKEWLRKCALLLPEIDRRQIWKKKGFSSLFEYAAKIAGMSRSTVEEAIRVLKHAEEKPEFKKVIEVKGIQSVRAVVAVATPETAAFWAEKAMEMSKNTLEVYVKEFKKAGFASPVADNRLEFLPREESQPEKLIAMKLEPEVAAELEKLKGQGEWNNLMKQLLELRRQKLETKKPQAVETESRHIPAKIEKYVVETTNGQCAFPDCTKPYKILHHTQRWALHNIHDPEKLVPLCTEHERLAHSGLIANEDQPLEKWAIFKNPIHTDTKFLVDQTVMEHRKST